MYEDLNTIAQLKFAKQIESISAQTREKVGEMQNEYVALTGSSGVRSGQHEASIARVQISGAEKLVRALSDIWIDLIKRRKGYISRPDVAFIADKAEAYARTQKGHLHTASAHQRMGAVVNLLAQEADRQMYAVATSIRTDLEIMAREYEAFPDRAAQQRRHTMIQSPKRRFSAGRRVLVGTRSRFGTIVSVDDKPGDMGEFRHIVTIDQDGHTLPVMGCDLQPFPELDEDLRQTQPPNIHLHIEKSSVANLNLGSQVGTINAALESISAQQGASPQDLALALKQLAEATVAHPALPPAEKQEIVQALSTLAEQATKKPEDRSKGTLRAVISWIPTSIAAAADLTSLWDKFGPAIRAYFGF
jgi:hypothetical protein